MWPFGKRDDDGEKDTRGMFKEATRALERGESEEGIRILAEVVREDPEFMAARVNLGAAYYARGEYVGAARQFEAAHELQPDNPKVLLNLAAAKSALDQLDEAIDLLIEALNLEPQMRDIHYNLAIAYWRKGRLPEAMAELEMELALHPDHQPAQEAVERIRSEGAPPGIKETGAPAANQVDEEQPQG
ncbi:MAG: tetratricopeptide repeat protein [candidate division WS1 bacterium]|jgi:tetratricopeptide (TPR) repeat protein|nr:tetratricopeptide repeat protein [candidate division WS1 bacterium]